MGAVRILRKQSMNVMSGATSAAALPWQLFATILVSVGCSALAQVSLKHGMSIASVQAALSAGGALRIAIEVAASPTVWLGLMLYGFSAVVWLFVLARLDVSVAYAFVALGFLLTMSLGCLLLGESLTLRKVCGTLLVMIGIWLVATGR
jgi:multidrug transporter EmrE-like cation transporter